MANDGKTNGVPPRPGPERALDAIDRRLLSALADRTDRSYADLGAEIGLSAPAAHERVKRLRAAGVLREAGARVDPAAIGKPLLAFVHVDTRGWGKSPAMLALSELPELEEIHSVTGDACLILKVRTASTADLEGLLARIYALPGVRGTRTYVALSTYLERTTRPETTAGLSATPAPAGPHEDEAAP